MRPFVAKAIAVASLFALLVLESVSKRFLLKPKYSVSSSCLLCAVIEEEDAS